MQVYILKYGNLTGSPDIKAMQWQSGVGTPEAHELFEDLFRIKLAWGLNGQSTSLLLMNSKAPEFFPAVVDLSYITPDPLSHTPETIRTALDRLADFDLRPEHIKSMLVTHPHGDHFDRRLLEFLPQATLIEPPVTQSDRKSAERAPGLSKWIEIIDTPGHAGPHQSFLFDQTDLDCSVCIAGDLIMSQAHFFNLDHPLAFSNSQQGKKSVAEILEALQRRSTKYKLIVPGHDIPFFANPYL